MIPNRGPGAARGRIEASESGMRGVRTVAPAAMSEPRPTRRARTGFVALVAAAALAAADPAAAVLIQTVSGTDNTTAPPDDPGFANVGYTTSGYGTGVYLGGGWVLTAGHVGGDGIVLASGTYLQASGSDTSFTLLNQDAGKSTYTDLSMFKLATEPAGLPAIPIVAAMPAPGTAVTMIGGGRDRGGLEQWIVDSSTTPWVWTGTSSGGDYSGYGTLGTRAIRWGTNTISGTGLWIEEGNDVRSLATTFDQLPGSTEAQAVLNDSGGAVFTKVDGAWQLAGIIFSVAGYSGQPDPIFTAVFGNETLMADLSYYRPQIVAIVPEPSGIGCASGAVGVAAAFAAWAGGREAGRRRRRRARE